MLKRMNSPRKPRAATAPTSPTIITPSHCPPLPLEIWTQIMRALVLDAVEDVPELWKGLRLLSHTLKAAIETAFADEHLSCAWLYVGDPHPEAMGPWTQPGAKRIVPLQLTLSHFSPDRRRAYFVGPGMLRHGHNREDRAKRGDKEMSLRISNPHFAECTDNTVVAEWLRSAHGIPPPGVRPTEGRLKLTIGPVCSWTHWKHPVIGGDGYVVESRTVTFEDDGGGKGDVDGDEEKGNNQETNKRKRKEDAPHAIGLEVDRTKCEVSLEWTTLVSCVFARPRRTFGDILRG